MAATALACATRLALPKVAAYRLAEWLGAISLGTQVVGRGLERAGARGNLESAWIERIAKAIEAKRKDPNTKPVADALVAAVRGMKADGYLWAGNAEERDDDVLCERLLFKNALSYDSVNEHRRFSWGDQPWQRTLGLVTLDPFLQRFYNDKVTAVELRNLSGVAANHWSSGLAELISGVFPMCRQITVSGIELTADDLQEIKEAVEWRRDLSNYKERGEDWQRREPITFLFDAAQEEAFKTEIAQLRTAAATA